MRVETRTDGPSTVVIEADGPLPAPEPGTVEVRPRIFFDFAGVLPATDGASAEQDPWIRRVRVAVHSQNPLLTRVVIDLFQAAPFKIEPSSGTPNRLVVSVGTAGPRPERPARAAAQRQASPAPVPPVRASAAPAAPARPGTARSPTYLKQVTAALARFENVRPVLSAIDGRADQPAVNLQLAVEQIEMIANELSALRPPRAMAAPHAQLLQACTLATQAVKIRIEFATSGRPALELNAASAAAGALLLLDHARATLGVRPDDSKVN